MLFRLFSTQALLASLALAIPAPAVLVPEALAPRAACPVTSRYASYSTSTVYRGTVTVTNGVVYNGPATSTKTESELRVITDQVTVYSPSVTTYPATTKTSYVASGPTSTLTFRTFAEYTTLPGYAPSDQCQVTTITNIIPGTLKVTNTYDLSYATVWFTSTNRVRTTTKVSWTTTTSTVTTPGSTVYATTVTVTQPTTPVEVIVATTTVTSYQQGCKSWACQA
ncbi:hypothetical protein V8F20_002488 [Naviculisporaceae sp. PSN 640]